MFILTAVIIYLVFVFAEKPSTSKRKANTDDSINDTNPNSSACPHCTAVLSAPKNLKRHIRDVHNLDTSPMMCIDIRNGIYVTAKYDQSVFSNSCDQIHHNSIVRWRSVRSFQDCLVIMKQSCKLLHCRTWLAKA